MGGHIHKEISPTLLASVSDNMPPCALGLDRASFNQGKNAQYDFSVLEEEQPTLTAKGPGAVCNRQSGAYAVTTTKGSTISMLNSRSSSTHTHTHGAGGTMDNYIVRRLTPLECERLQGFPNGWTDIGDWEDSKGKTHKGDSDSPRYKALGNSIATGDNSFWKFLLKRIIAQYDYDPTMASLFDGIGGFPLLWEQLSGIGNTLWASEIEEFPIAVTKQHFPCMQHLGDITKINGAEVPVVDCIIGGSPCQDLSVAGKRAGLDGERSGLFMEQIRIIKEMRANDMARGRTGEFIRPRYGVWENVPGAFSSNKGEDFRAVIEEFCKVSGGGITIPKPDKWTRNGAVVGEGFSVAWTVHDAKDWCVPQRRQRISLVADFGGQSAPEILFVRKGLSGDSQPSREAGQDSAGDSGDGSEDYH